MRTPLYTHIVSRCFFATHFIILLVLGATGFGQVYEKVFSFTDAIVADLAEGANKGSGTYAGVVQGSDGNFYGTTVVGGANDSGTVFLMTSVGVLTTLVEFTGNGTSNKGREPFAELVQGSDGNFYGTTAGGGANGL